MVCHIFYAVTVHQQTAFNTLAAVLVSLAKAGRLLERQRNIKRKQAKQTPKYMHKTYTIGPCMEKTYLYILFLLINTSINNLHTLFFILLQGGNSYGTAQLD